MPQALAIEPAGPADEPRWTPFLFSVAYLGWVWLLPIRLGEGTWAPELFAGVMAASWLAQGVSAAVWQRNRAGSSRRFHGPVAALFLVPVVAAVAMVQQPALVALAFVAFGALMGVLSTQSGIARSDQGHLPGASQALGEWVGPLLGAGLVLAGGPPAVFVGAGLSAMALAWSLNRERFIGQD
jgi:hypothetical protein